MNGTSVGTVLFLPLSKGNLLEMLPVARAMRTTPWHPVFCLDAKVAPLVSLLEGMSAMRPDGGELRPTAPARPDAAPVRKAGWKEHAFPYLPSFIRSLLMFRRERMRARKLLAGHPDIRLIVVAGDRNIGIETAMVAEGKRRGIRSLIVPFAMSFPEASAEPRLRTGHMGGKYGVQTPVRKLLRRFFPSWVWVYKGVPLFFQPPSFALAAWTLGMMPKKPWMIGGGEATTMAVESEALRGQLLAQGMPAGKMIVTGKPGLDDVARQIASVKTDDIRKKLGIAPGEKLILCSVPNFAEHDLLPWDRHKEEMQFLFQTLAATGARVLLNLHPRSDRAWYQPLADAARLTISDERVYNLLPACDLFVASYSSTVAQAIALCKPSIVIDFYDFLYPVYDDAPGAMVLRDRDRFFPLLQELLGDTERYDACIGAQREHGKAWALMDGRNTERVLAVAEELMVGAMPC